MPTPDRRSLRAAGVFALLLAASAASYAAAYLLRFAADFPPARRDMLLASVAWAALVKTAALAWFGIDRGWRRSVGFHDLVLLTKAVTAGTAAIALLDTMIFTGLVIPRSIVLIDWGVSLLLLAGVRGAPRWLRDVHGSRQTPAGAVRSLIVGANASGELILRAIRSNPKLRYRPIGFIDDDVALRGQRVAGVPVVGRTHDLERLVALHGIEEVLLATGSLPGKSVRDLLDRSAAGDFRLKVLPSYEQLLRNEVEVVPRPVAIADLLRRPSVRIDDRNVHDLLGGRAVLVTGSAGSIGSEICRQLLPLRPAALVLVDRHETGQFFLERELRQLAPDQDLRIVLADLADVERMRQVFAEHRPAVVFHAAAYKHVPLMEANPGEAVKNIVLTTRDLADCAEEFGSERFVLISTDKAVNPSNVMGACKRMAEQYVQAKNSVAECRFVAVRFGNVLDSAGSVVPIFREQIARGGPVTVTHPEMVRYFMLIPEAAQLVIQAGAMGQGGEAFVLDMGEPVRILDLAKDMIRLSGLRLDEDIEIDVIGLRPGEKLFEELYHDQERRQPTGHPKIMATSAAPRSLLEVSHEIGRLAEAADRSSAEVFAELRSVLTTFRPVDAAPAAAERRRAA